MKLTEKIIAGLTANPTGRDFLAWDDALPCFGIRIKPSGHKSYVIQYRTAAGASRRHTIGASAVLRLEQARARARRLLVAVSDGADPARARADARKAETVSQLCDRYLIDHAEQHKKPSSARSDRRLIAANIKPRLGTMKLAAITSADVSRLHHNKRTTPYEANRTLALLRKMFNLAETWGLRPSSSNPCRGIKQFREKKRERFLSQEELGRLGHALSDAEQSGTELQGVILAIKLLALTGCRVGEILSATWDHIDLPAGLLRLADAKAGARNVPLGSPVVALLSGQPTNESSWLVSGADPSKRLSYWTLEAAWRRIRDAANLPEVRLHDLRHTTGTFAGQAGLNAFVVRDLLGHKTLAMTSRYVQRDADPLRIAANTVSGRIAAAMAGGKAADVVPLPRRQT
jgi:integrase